MQKLTAARQKVYNTIFNEGLIVTGISIAGLGAPKVGIVVAVLGGGIAIKKLYKSIKDSYELEDQCPDYHSLVQQLRRSNHVVVAHIKVRDQIKSFIVGCKDPARFKGFIYDGRGKELKEVLKLDKENSVVFTGGPPR